jgi:hypothetical protein
LAFPQTPLPIQVEISLDNTTWTDITSDVRSDSQIRINRGRSNWASSVEAGQCSFALSNTDGKYSPRNPTGPYYGSIGRNTPVRVSVKTGSVALWLPGTDTDYAATPDNAALDITGDIDVRFDATLLNWYLADSAEGAGNRSVLTELVGKYNTTGNQCSWVLYTQDGLLCFSWSPDGTNANSVNANSSVKLPVPASGRLAVRATLDVDNGSGGLIVRFYTSDSINGAWTQLGADATGNFTTSIFNSTADLRIGNAIGGLDSSGGYMPALGRVHAVQVLNGIGGTAVANPDFTAQTIGAGSFTDSAGRTWSVNGMAEITNRKTRFVGEVSSWTPVWDTGGFDVTCQVEAAGVMRRMGQGAVPIKSPMVREFTSPSRTNIVAYWPMEDASGATSLGSAIDGHPPMMISGAVTPAAYSSWAASDPVPTVDTGYLRATVPNYTATNYLFLRVFVAVPAAGVSSTQRLLSVTQSGTATTWSVYLNSAGDLDLRAYSPLGAQLLSTGFNGTHAINGAQKSIGVELTVSGSDIAYRLFVYDVQQSTLTNAVFTSTSGTLTSQSLGRALQVRFGEDSAMAGTAFGHLAISDSNTGFLSTAGALVGWNGETAAARVHRLGLEESITSYATAPGDEQMGVQGRDTILNLMRDAEGVDEGILAEQRSILGVRLVQRASMYNQTPVFTLDYAGSDGLVAPLAPTEDDQRTSNDVTVQRSGGSSGRATEDEGALSLLPPPDGIGTYASSYTLNLFDDTQPANHAGWRLHLGTWDEIRYPVVSVNLAEAPASIEAATKVDVGCRMQINNPPAWLPPGIVDLRAEGYTETLAQFTWKIDYNCSPCGPYTVAYESDARADTDGTTLAAAATSTATTLYALTQAGSSVWTTDVTDLPFDIAVGGETVQVEPSGTVLNSNAGFETGTTGWTPTNATLARSSSIHRVGSWSALLTTGSGSNPRAEADMSAVTAGNTYTAMGWLYTPAPLPQVAGINVNWYDASRAYLSTSGNTTTLKTGVWTPFNAQFTAPVGAAYAGVLFTVANTPGAGYLLYADNVKLINGATGITSFIKDTFTRTVSNGWGTPDIGAAWTTTGGSASDYAVGSGYGSVTLASVNSSRNTSVTAIHPDSDTYCDMTTSALATGDSLFGAVVARMVDTSNRYLARLEFNTSNAIVLTVQKSVAGALTQLGTAYTLSLTHVAGTFIRVRFQLSGTTLRAKAWLATSMEPTSWAIEVTDTSFTAAGSIGTRSISGPSNTNASPQIRYENFETINPQTFTVSRSVNGVVKAQSAGADIRLTTPAYVAL